MPWRVSWICCSLVCFGLLLLSGPAVLVLGEASRLKSRAAGQKYQNENSGYFVRLAKILYCLTSYSRSLLGVVMWHFYRKNTSFTGSWFSVWTYRKCSACGFTLFFRSSVCESSSQSAILWLVAAMLAIICRCAGCLYEYILLGSFCT